MSNGLTEIVYILDRSGSMSGLEEDTIGGFNDMISKQKKTNEKAYVSVILFDYESEVLVDRIPIQQIKEMTNKEYYVRGSTALLDAIGGAIRHMANVHKYARKEDRPNKTIFVITTDGQENSSREFSYKKIKQMIEYEKGKYGWEFIFVGANIDACFEAEKMGIRRERAVNYVHDSFGTAKIFNGISDAICGALVSDDALDMEESLNTNDWKKEIEQDFKTRFHQNGVKH